MFIPENSWIEILREANRHRDQGLIWNSPVMLNPYRISEIGEGNNPMIVVERCLLNTYDTISNRKVFNLINRLVQNDQILPANRDAMAGAKMDVAAMSTIVHLHPWLDYSTIDNVRYIIVRKFPKVSLFGTATFSPEDGGQLQRAARNIRKGQPGFRNDLLELYDHTCCISGTKLDNVLDAAHIIPYSENGGTNPANGLLLRTDIHNLFDDGLISINPSTFEVHVSADLQDTEYYLLHGKPLAKRIDNTHPSIESLIWRWENPVV